MFRIIKSAQLIGVICLLQLIFVITLRAQQQQAFPTDTLLVQLTAEHLDSSFKDKWWRYANGDDETMATKNFNDSAWQYIQSENIDSSIIRGIGWFRLHFTIDTSLAYKPIAITMRQKGASEIYLDGKLIKRYGTIKDKDSTEYYDPQGVPVIIVIDSVGEHVLAIRYARYHFDDKPVGFLFGMDHANNAIEIKRGTDVAIASFIVVLFVAFLTLGFLHFLFFLFYKHIVSNLWFSIFMFCISGIWASIFLANFSNEPQFIDRLKDAIVIFACLSSATFVFFIHIQFNNKGRIWMIIALLLSVAALVGYFTDAFEFSAALMASLVYAAVYSVVSLLRAIIKKIKGALILGIGFGFFLVTLLLLFIIVVTVGELVFDASSSTSSSIVAGIVAVVLLLDIVSIPLTMSVYQAWMFARLNKDLSLQLKQVQDLSATTIKQEQEKKQILENQNVELEKKVAERTSQLTTEKHKSDSLLLNILPGEVAEELKRTGGAEAKQYNNVSVLFTDFVNFTGLSELMTPTELVQVIHRNFTAFDAIIEKHGLEKIKTIGDAYMAVCGLPMEVADHAQRCVRAAQDIQEYIEKESGQFQIKVGISSGPVVAGIVGVKKYAYDIWGDTVNTAARMEQNSEAGKINISGTTYELVKREFNCLHRGKIQAKNKGEIDMYFVN